MYQALQEALPVTEQTVVLHLLALLLLHRAAKVAKVGQAEAYIL